ncbi:MAG: hypothetical protein DRP65_09815 [Planctomycetota bacterium]|nr:MAG: hypothetical protein DRP65_09815 [Planctomycetota bacterium]
MRFFALLKKELCETLPWIVLAAFLLVFCGAIFIGEYTRQRRGFTEPATISPRSFVRMDTFREEMPLRDIGALLLYTSCCLGLVLAVRQFLVPSFLKTWAFTIHRSVSRTTILLGKFAAAIIALILSCGIIWTLFCWYASKPGLFQMPLRQRTFAEGWIFISLGLVVYLGTVLSALSTARWYITRMFGLVFASCIYMLLLLQTGLALCLATIIVSLVILVSQIIHTFLNREF